MSNDKSTPPAPPKAPTVVAAGEERMRSLRFVAAGLPIENANAHNPVLNARMSADHPRGFDIYFENAARRYRLEAYESGAIAKKSYVHESRVEVAEAWTV